MIYFYKSAECVSQTAKANKLYFVLYLYLNDTLKQHSMSPADRLNSHRDSYWKLKMLSQTVRIRINYTHYNRECCINCTAYLRVRDIKH